MEENKTHPAELLELLETVTEDLYKINYKQVNIIIENVKAFIKKVTIITQRMISEKEHENQLSHIITENQRTQEVHNEAKDIHRRN